MKHGQKGLRARLVSTASLFILLAGTARVTAEQASYNLNIEAKPLGSAINQLSKETDLVIFVAAELVEGLNSPAVSGALTIEKALSQMLAETNLYSEQTGDGIYVIKERETPKATSALKEKAAFVMEEIVVTATKREQKLLDVPASIVAYGSDRLKDSGVKDIRDVQFLAAGLQIGNDQTGDAAITMRGISSPTRVTLLGLEGTTAMHKDGVYLWQRGEHRNAFFDVERIEVLRGPQGTLYGKNATSGAINVITKNPTEEFDFGAKVTAGNYGLIEAEGFASGPLADGLLGRIAFQSSHLGGYGTNLYRNNKVAGNDSTALRAKLLYDTGGAFSMNLVVDYAEGSASVVQEAKRLDPDVPLVPETLGYDVGSGFDVNWDNSPIQNRSAWGASLRAEWDLGFATLSSLSGYRDYALDSTFDVDNSPLFRLHMRYFNTDAYQFSEELNLASSGDGDFQWIVGAFYFHGQMVNDAKLDIPPIVQNFYDETQKTDSYAVFGEASYRFGRATLTLGGRYGYEKKHTDDYRTDPPVPLEDSWGSFTPKIAINYAVTERVSAYATVGKGTKSGGFLTGTPYDEETVTNYEAGVKASLWDRRLQTNLAVFTMDYKNLQAEVRREVQPNIFQNFLANAASATISGVELDFMVRPTDHLSIDGNISYLDATYDVFKDFYNAIDRSVLNVSGNVLPGTPKWASNIGVSYSFDLSSWLATARVEHSYQSFVHFSPANDVRIGQPGNHRVNARITFDQVEGDWQVSAYVKNLGNELVRGNSYGGLSGIVGFRSLSTYLPPRTYGVSVGYRF